MKKLAESIQMALVAPMDAASTPAMTGPAMSLHDAHVLSGKVKGAIRAAVPTVTPSRARKSRRLTS